MVASNVEADLAVGMMHQLRGAAPPDKHAAPIPGAAIKATTAQDPPLVLEVVQNFSV